ncbi:ABC transporter substrate-binding protein [uncultured Desulfobacter sp.]|uniref:ABC transporter substrate-binding protein n=1 Tax=uncultured Desulfobacter sp. TaxID=240139 RepID=UPI002AABDCFD|nr:ABC transporter substrate-binding protein [uncultured Desulfobacter sp.]
MDVISFAMCSWEQMEKGFDCGDINAAFMDIAQAMYLFDKGLSIAMLMFTHRAGSRIIVPGQILRLANLKGKSVLIPHRFSIQHMLVHRLLTTGKLAIAGENDGQEYVSIEAVPCSLMPEMTSADPDGDIAAFICPGPFGDTEIEKKGFRHLLISRDLWKDHPGSVFVVHQDLINTKDQSLGLMVRCLLDGARQLDRYMSSPDTGEKEIHDIQKVAAAFLSLSEDQIQKSLKTSGIAYTPKLLLPDMNILNIVLDYMSTTMQVMPAGADLDGFVRPEFIHSALSENLALENRN